MRIAELDEVVDGEKSAIADRMGGGVDADDELIDWKSLVLTVTNQGKLSGITPKMVTQTLKELEAEELIGRKIYLEFHRELNIHILIQERN